VYFDNAATTLKPKTVVDAMADHYLYKASNIHRGVHFLSEQATTAHEVVREKVRDFIGASDKSEIIFTRGTTESINIVALSYGREFLKAGDEILISTMEHHSNIVPWQILCEEKGCVLKVIPINDNGEIIFEEFEKLLSSKTKLLSIVYISNSLGTVNPIRKMIEAAHHYHVPILIDGAQVVAHHAVNMKELDCDFFSFSSHKIFGPTGLGVLYGKADFLNKMPPVFGGGDMIDTVTFEKTTYNVIPHKFEAGTPHIAGVVGLGAALDYVQSVGLDVMSQHEQEILHYATDEIKKIAGIRLIGTAKEKGAILAFVMEGAHAHDIGTLVDMEGVAIRTGHHCTQPLMKRFGVSATARASFSMYNTFEEVDVFINALKKVRKMFS
jgi:cysteine desulfurase/selenocysteine lyase